MYSYSNKKTKSQGKPIQRKKGFALQDKRSKPTIQRVEGDEEDSDPGYNVNINPLGKGGKRSHHKSKPDDKTTKVVGSASKTQRQKKTIDRHLARLKAGEGRVTGMVDGGAGPITVVKLKSTKKGNTDHIYGIKHPGGDGKSAFHPRTPELGGEYDSDSDED